jgi:hypothetical protein
MRRISALLAVSLTAALLITMLAVGVAGASSSHSANNAAEVHLFSATLAPDLAPKVEPKIAGIVPGSLPWVLKSGQVNLSKGGLLEASVGGLLFGPGAPAKLVGTTGPIKQVFASLVCMNGPVISTNPVALSNKGDAHIHQRISLPASASGRLC